MTRHTPRLYPPPLWWVSCLLQIVAVSYSDILPQINLLLFFEVFVYFSHSQLEPISRVLGPLCGGWWFFFACSLSPLMRLPCRSKGPLQSATSFWLPWLCADFLPDSLRHFFDVCLCSLSSSLY
ncbi:hypothetical protein DFJ73DRAFT_866568 [Zopfochytrium polystomum]|nr:hypothetical protein DFJ73DRAFT_866568 [Zopfochytrium polystomum]